MKTLEFIKENGKDYKIETYKKEIDLVEVPKQIVWLQNMIAAKKEEIAEMEADLKEVKKLLDVEKIPA